jgi:hypothetical protein
VKSHIYEGMCKGMRLYFLGENLTLPFLQNGIRGFHDLLKENLPSQFMLFGLMQLELNYFLHEPVPAAT